MGFLSRRAVAKAQMFCRELISTPAWVLLTGTWRKSRISRANRWPGRSLS